MFAVTMNLYAILMCALSLCVFYGATDQSNAPRTSALQSPAGLGPEKSVTSTDGGKRRQKKHVGETLGSVGDLVSGILDDVRHVVHPRRRHRQNIYLPPVGRGYATRPDWFNYRPGFRPDYRPYYAPSYEPMYIPDYGPIYIPSNGPDYGSGYGPGYRPSYGPGYGPGHSPGYVYGQRRPVNGPAYESNYDPQYDLNYESTTSSDNAQEGSGYGAPKFQYRSRNK